VGSQEKHDVKKKKTKLAAGRLEGTACKSSASAPSMMVKVDNLTDQNDDWSPWG